MCGGVRERERDPSERERLRTAGPEGLTARKGACARREGAPPGTVREARTGRLRERKLEPQLLPPHGGEELSAVPSAVALVTADETGVLIAARGKTAAIRLVVGAQLSPLLGKLEGLFGEDELASFVSGHIDGTAASEVE